jgi:hypothetical protein
MEKIKNERNLICYRAALVQLAHDVHSGRTNVSVQCVQKDGPTGCWPSKPIYIRLKTLHHGKITGALQNAPNVKQSAPN